MPTHIRQATAEELPALWRQRYVSYAEGMGLPMRAADHATRMLRDDIDDASHQIVVVVDGAIVGGVRLTRPEVPAAREFVELYRLGELHGVDGFIASRMVLGQDGRRGLPTLISLLRHIADTTRACGGLYIAIDCQPHLLSLFGRIGFEQSGAAFRHPDSPTGPVHTPMLLRLHDKAHLESVGSPIADGCVDAPIHSAINERLRAFAHAGRMSAGSGVLSPVPHSQRLGGRHDEPDECVSRFVHCPARAGASCGGVAGPASLEDRGAP